MDEDELERRKEEAMRRWQEIMQSKKELDLQTAQELLELDKIIGYPDEPPSEETKREMREIEREMWAYGPIGPNDKILSRGICSDTPEDDYTSDERYDAVLIWDLEEITKLSEDVTRLSDRMKVIAINEEPILQSDISILDKYMNNILASIGFNDEINVDNIEEIMNDGSDIMNRMGPKYKELRELYEQMKEGKMDPNGMINYDLIEKCGMSDELLGLYLAVGQHQTKWSQCWKEANQCLKLINNRPVDQHPKMTNVVISRQGIAHAAVQLLISNNASMIPIQNLYTVANSSNEQIFEKITYRFGKRCRFAMITTSEALADAAGKNGVPIWKIGNWQQIQRNIEEVLKNVFVC